MRRAIAGFAVVVLVGVAGACVAPRNGLGTSSSACFQGLPAADAAQHDHGHLVGVRAVSGGTARDVLNGKPDVLVPAGDDEVDIGKRVCLFAFHGTFGAGSVDQESSASRGTGDYAVVAVTMRDPRAIGAVVVDHLPLHFHHL